MRILEVSRYKNNFADNQLPFVTEQAPIGIRTLRYRTSGGLQVLGRSKLL